jgi:porphobilinogen deaminase
LVAAQLKAARPELEIEIVSIKTSGDLFSARNPKAATAPEGCKGLFVKEIEDRKSVV